MNVINKKISKVMISLACAGIMLATSGALYAQNEIKDDTKLGTPVAVSNGVATNPATVVSQASDDLQNRLALARELHDIKHVKDHIRETITAASVNLPVVEREDFKKYMELKIDFDDLEKKSIQYTAEIYTAAELQAMIDYFGSTEGRSAEVKGEEYAKKFGAEVRKTIDQAIMAAKFDNVDSSLPKSLPTSPLTP